MQEWSLIESEGTVELENSQRHYESEYVAVYVGWLDVLEGKNLVVWSLASKWRLHSAVVL